MAKPTDFFVGVSDLFAIFLPGACITYICLKLCERSDIHPVAFLRFSTTNEGYVGFVAVAYIAGHLLDMLGAFVLDRIYDFTYAHRKRSPALTLWRWIFEIPRRFVKSVSNTLGLGIAPSRTDLEDQLPAEAQRLAAGAITPGDPVYQWCKAWVCLQNPAAFNEVERLQANSKFFRGLVSVFSFSALLAIAVTPLLLHRTETFAACLFLAMVSFLRFCDLRWKAVHQTYRFYVAIKSEALTPPHSSDPAEDESD